jgi:hypothetical protein
MAGEDPSGARRAARRGVGQASGGTGGDGPAVGERPSERVAGGRMRSGEKVV